MLPRKIIWVVIVLAAFTASRRVVHITVEATSHQFIPGQRTPFGGATFEDPGNSIEVFLRTAMPAFVKHVLAATLLEALHHRLVIDPMKDVVVARMADQAIYPTLGKTIDETFNIRFVRVREYHAIPGLHMDDEQHVLALNGNSVDQPLLG
jgi:hypothetical protein